MDTKNKVSIITPAFNCAETILDVIASIQRQGPVVREHIIVNDGSTDQSRIVIEEVMQTTKIKIRLLNQNNAGEASAVNNAVAISEGEYLMIVNSDDPLLDSCVETLVSSLELNPAAAVAYANWNMIDENGHLLQNMFAEPFSYCSLIGNWTCIVGPGALIRKSTLGGLPARNEKYSHLSDFELWLRLAATNSFVKVESTLSTWRKSDNNATHQGRGASIAHQNLQLLDDYFSNPNIPNEIKKIEKRARAHAYYSAALQMFFDSNVKGRRLIIKSYASQMLFLDRRCSSKRSLIASISILLHPIPILIAGVLERMGVGFPAFAQDAVKARKKAS
jgi:glycosyltransferase involved in cell wall biosynthesis